ncbi:hypothetical protein BU16DRAFT_525808 [Lophium mytilinum]|uniref:Dienelactone hydrolase domain-containing protein n=1 Tax=Lophium mytilinum TaxID=390894 RepID=A0A6A6QW60_9PEZI|nr:hypothetical protein BU16DRAFT_525808 [Lophium mytilinum]
MTDAVLNPACCSRPAVVTGDYTPKGTYEDIAGFKTYISGPATSTAALILIHDIYGPVTQILQGADRLAAATGQLILTPDFFKGKTIVGQNLFPMDTEEKKEKMGKFFAEVAGFEEGTKSILAIHKAAGEKYSSVTTWGAFGLCWGGKVTALASAEGSLFKAAGTAHPGRLAIEEAEAITIPYICLFSKDEDTPLGQEYGKILMSSPKAKGSVFETYGTMHHGWMGARANLEDEENAKEYVRGYEQAAEFFKALLV